MRLLDRILEAAQERGLLNTRGRARTDSTIVLAATRKVNGLVMLGETLRAALNAVAGAEPQWLTSWCPPEWFDRYAVRFEDSRLPKGDAKKTEMIEQIGADGMRLLSAVYEAHVPERLRWLPAVQTLRSTWVQQYLVDDGRVRRRDGRAPGASRLVTPYDPDVRGSFKRGTFWDGYKVHLTETCEPDSPNLITHVATTASTVQDVSLVQPIHDALAERDRLPEVHLVDAGYATARDVVTARKTHSIELLGPVLAATNWQSKENVGFTQESFGIDWENRAVTCPNGKTTSNWQNDISPRGTPVVRVVFRASQCNPCPDRGLCTRVKEPKRGRRLTLRPEAEHAVIQEARKREDSAEWQERYAHRAGV